MAPREAQPVTPGRSGQGIQRRFDRFARRIHLLEKLVATLTARCRLQEELIRKTANRSFKRAWRFGRESVIQAVKSVRSAQTLHRQKAGGKTSHAVMGAVRG